MKRFDRVAAALAIAVALAAGGALGAAAGDKAAPAKTATAPAPSLPASPPSPLIYPAETIPLKFDHAQHARLGATCEGCHLSAQTSTSAADNLIPREAACRSCHKIDRAQPDKAVPQGRGGRALRRLPRRRERQPVDAGPAPIVRPIRRASCWRVPT